MLLFSLLYLDNLVVLPVSWSMSSRPLCIDMLSKLSDSLLAKYSGVSRSSFLGFDHNFNIKLEPTTETELRAIAALAIQGASMNPIMLKAPAASGIPVKVVN